VDDELRRRLEDSGYAAPGFAERYDRHRPHPPSALLELLPALAGVDRSRLVVDLGSGTGLSTRFWCDAADEVVGVEANDAMREYATRVTAAANVRYLGAPAHGTGLPDACADIVTAAQSLGWMRPERVLPEVARILRPGGIFCAYDYFVIQTPLWEPVAEWESVLARKGELRTRYGLDAGSRSVPTLELLVESGAFRRTRELVLHSVEAGDGDRLVGFALSEGSMQTLLAAGATEEEVGLDRLRAAASAMSDPVPWWIGYRVLLGLR